MVDINGLKCYIHTEMDCRKTGDNPSLKVLMKNLKSYWQWPLSEYEIISGSFSSKYNTGHSQHNMLKTLTNSYEQIRSFANKNEVRVNKFIKIRKNEVTTSFLIHENEFVIPNSW